MLDRTIGVTLEDTPATCVPTLLRTYTTEVPVPDDGVDGRGGGGRRRGRDSSGSDSTGVGTRDPLQGRSSSLGNRRGPDRRRSRVKASTESRNVGGGVDEAWETPALNSVEGQGSPIGC